MKHEMYPTRKCSSCEKEEYVYKTLRLESNEFVCADCYYEALEKNGIPLMTLEELKDTTYKEKSYRTRRTDFINLLRKYINKHQSSPMIVMEDIAKREVALAKEIYSKDYKDLSIIEKHNLLRALRTVELPRYFKDDSMIKEVEEYESKLYFRVNDYLEKLKTYMS